jgi:hypothetical protein
MEAFKSDDDEEEENTSSNDSDNSENLFLEEENEEDTEERDTNNDDDKEEPSKQEHNNDSGDEVESRKVERLYERYGQNRGIRCHNNNHKEVEIYLELSMIGSECDKFAEELPTVSAIKGGTFTSK